ncbi:MAG: hypothetical protein ACOX6P_11420 [Candidatus Merdivicinus sp.]|jgi:hypothetical protein
MKENIEKLMKAVCEKCFCRLESENMAKEEDTCRGCEIRKMAENLYEAGVKSGVSAVAEILAERMGKHGKIKKQ